jgi:N6-adenosine-specific RNA methylase IME4
MTTFNVIVADPPWAFNDSLVAMKRKVKRSAASQYDVLGINDIEQLDVRSLADQAGSILVLWVPSSMLSVGLNVMSSWGFSFKQTFVWVKTKKDARKEIDMNDSTRVGMGRLFRQSHEIALVGTCGKVYPHLVNKSQRSVAFDKNRKHSAKPELLQDRLELMFPAVPKLELFGRRARKDWTVIGDEIDGKDIRDAIQDLKML